MMIRARKFQKKGSVIEVVDYGAEADDVKISEIENTRRRAAVLHFLATISPHQVYSISETDESPGRATIVYYRT